MVGVTEVTFSCFDESCDVVAASLHPGALAQHSVVTPINLTKSGLAAKRPHVLLFLHIGKCGGTTVRSIFQHAGGWVRPIWSITQRFSGWKANRMLHSLHSSMAQGAQKIFIEWHIVRNPPAPHLQPRAQLYSTAFCTCHMYM